MRIKLCKHHKAVTVETYAADFLTAGPTRQRQDVYIDRSLHKRITFIVGMSGKRVSAGQYVDNILRRHLTEYEQTIREYCDNRYRESL